MDAAGNSPTVFETRNTVSCKKFGRDGRQCGMLVNLVNSDGRVGPRRSGRETTAADVRLSGT